MESKYGGNSTDGYTDEYTVRSLIAQHAHTINLTFLLGGAGAAVQEKGG
jgi:hypothetical protein